MKTRLTMLKFLIILCGFFAMTAVFGQTTYTWTNSAGGDLATAANWNPNGVPLGNNSDTMQFDGQTAGPVAATSNTGAQTGYSGGAWGTEYSPHGESSQFGGHLHYAWYIIGS